jgi:hypothetical protein
MVRKGHEQVMRGHTRQRRGARTADGGVHTTKEGHAWQGGGRE